MAYANSFIVGSQAAMVALVDARLNDICKRTDIQETFILTALPPSNISNWSQIAPSTSSVVAGAGIQIADSVISSLTPSNSLYAATFGVVADGQFVYDAVSQDGLNTITSASANFTQADVGKIVFGIDNTGANTAPVQGTITAVVNANTITVSNAATASKTAVTLGWGTDDTAACETAWTAAVAAQSYLVLPSGYIFVQASLFNITSAQSLALTKGLGLLSDGTSIIVPTPTFNFASAPSTTSALFANWGAGNADMYPNYFYMANLTIYGAGFNATGLGGASNSILSFVQEVAYNIQLWDWTGTAVGIQIEGPVYAFWVAVDTAGTWGMAVSGGQPISLYSCYSLGSINLLISGAGSTVQSFGSNWGQSNSNPAISIGAGTFFSSYGEQYLGGFGGTNARTFDVAGTLHLHGAQIISTANEYGINVESGGRAFVSNTMFNLSGSSPAPVTALINVNGVYVDDGTNNIVAGAFPGSVAGNITLSTGWGTSGVAGNGVSGVIGDNRRFQFTITAAGTPSANPTIVIDFPWLQARTPLFICKQIGGTGAIAQVSGEASATTGSMTLTWNGTPQASDTYIFQCISE